MIQRNQFKRSVLALAIGLTVANGIQAQSTTGSIYGNVPAADGTTIIAKNEAA